MSHSASTYRELLHEREFVETMQYQRFNIMLIFYSLVIAGSAATTSQAKMTILLVLGCVICLLVSITIYRSQRKLQALLQLIDTVKESNPIKLSRDAIGGRSTTSLIGYVIPTLCWLSLAVASILSVLGILPAAS